MMKKRRCCILFNQPREGALADELDVLDQVEFIEKHLKELDIDVYRKGITSLFMKEIEELSAEKPDFVFNLVESINNKGELSYFIPALLNLNGIPYSGNSLEAIFTTTSKVLTSRILRTAGVSNPKAFSPSQHHLLIPGNKYIVKPVWEDGSLGITEESVFIFNNNGVAERLKALDDTHWFIEDFVDGREFNISVLAGEKGPQIMPPAEIVFKNYTGNKPKIVDFKAKWEMESFEYLNTVREFPGIDLNPVLKEKLMSTALKCWHLFGLKGYARVDMRTDENENPFVIEINANPCISPDGGFVAATKEAGLQFNEVLHRIISDLNNK
jgi:D-alanine-D-alanine ligase